MGDVQAISILRGEGVGMCQVNENPRFGGGNEAGMLDC